VGLHLGDVDVDLDAGAFPSAVSCQRYSRSETRHEMVTRPFADEERIRCGMVVRGDGGRVLRLDRVGQGVEQGGGGGGKRGGGS
jgi:hypothetical protein